MEKINEKYESLLRQNPSDIADHLPTLYMFAKECESIIECGVDRVISTWALTKGLLENGKPKKSILLNDNKMCNIHEYLSAACQFPELRLDFAWMNDLDLKIDENVDMVFIDTWHVYGKLKRELAKFSQVTNKYIIMHDTTIDEIVGETIREKKNAWQQSQESGIPIEEIVLGVGKAIDEFLRDHPEWKVKVRYINNNGLTVLERVA